MANEPLYKIIKWQKKLCSAFQCINRCMENALKSWPQKTEVRTTPKNLRTITSWLFTSLVWCWLSKKWSLFYLCSLWRSHYGQESQERTTCLSPLLVCFSVCSSPRALFFVPFLLSRLNFKFYQDLLWLPGMSQSFADKIFQQWFKQQPGLKRPQTDLSIRVRCSFDPESFRAVVAKLGSWVPTRVTGSVQKAPRRQLPTKQPSTLIWLDGYFYIWTLPQFCSYKEKMF